MRLDPTTLLPMLLTLTPLAAAARPKDAILLSEVHTLTLHSRAQTTSRRVPAIPQLKCVSHPRLCALSDIRTMRCTNQGASYTAQDINWSCTASLPSTVQLDRTEVICEGYDHADDVYVLRGSCGVEYTVRLTEEGRRRFPELKGGKYEGGGGGAGGDWAVWLFWALFLAVLGWIVWGAFIQGGGGTRLGQQGQAGRRPGWGGGGGGGWGGGWGPGGGGGGGWNDPPPPYSGPKPSTEGGWRPGFWSGLAGGAAAGYMAGNRGNRGYNNRNDYGRAGGLRREDSGSGWGGGRSSSFGSSSGSSGTRHESTGFGSTSRR